MESLDLSYEPMDVDVSSISSQSGKERMDISYSDTETVSYTLEPRRIENNNQLLESNTCQNDILIQKPTIKKYHLNIHKPHRNYRYCTLKILCAGLFAFCSVIIYQTLTLKCCDDYNIDKLNESMTNKLFGQEEAIRVILETMGLEDRSKILLFSGGTGVGKTFISSIMIESLGTCSNTYHYTMPSFAHTFSTDLMVGLTMCDRSIIIVDDLTADDMDINSIVHNIVEKTEYLKKHVIVILIFNCYNSFNEFNGDRCNNFFYRDVLDKFEHIKALKRLVRFKPLTNKHLKLCIETEMGNRKLSDLEFESLSKNFNVTVDGCKGVHSKMKYMNII